MLHHLDSTDIQVISRPYRISFQHFEVFAIIYPDEFCAENNIPEKLRGCQKNDTTGIETCNCCIPGYPDAWSKVTEVLDWIEGIIEEGGQSLNTTTAKPGTSSTTAEPGTSTTTAEPGTDSGAGSYTPMAIRMLGIFHLGMLCIKKAIQVW